MSTDKKSSVLTRDPRALVVRLMTFLGGLYFFFYFVAPETFLQRVGIDTAHESISNGFIAIGSMAIGLGIINIVYSHGSKVIFRKQGWIFSLTLLAGLVVMIGVTFSQWFHQMGTSEQIRRVQVIEDFATRIVDDAKSAPGHQKSFSSHGTIPQFSVRVAALERYIGEVCSSIRMECEAIAAANDSNPALKVFLEEVTQAVALVETSRSKLSQYAWEGLDSEGEEALRALTSNAAKMSSAYALAKRDIESRSLITRLYNFLYNGLFNNLGSAMFSLLGVYIAAAAYRAFRIQSFESALMMSAALVVMLGQISFGKTIYEDMPALRQWLLEVPNSAAFRAIRLGAAVAGLMLAIRMWLSIESSSRKERP